MILHSYYTNNGRALAAKIAAGTAEMTITRVVAGDGHTADIPSATDLPSQKQTLSVGLPTVSGATAMLPVTLLEAQAVSDYALTELGVYAEDPDVGEILFQVCQLSESADITAGGEGLLRFYLRLSIGAPGVSVTCSPAGVVLEEDIAELRARDAYADHRNLLDNAWFTVNQRGQESYTEHVYTVDRWKKFHGELSVVSGGVSWIYDSAYDGANDLEQFFEFPDRIPKGTAMTVSINIDGEIYSAPFWWRDMYNGQTLVPNKITVFSVIERPFIIRFHDDVSNIRAVKLELGSVSTLANDIAPDYAQELMKCQRYFQRFKTQSLRPADADDFRPVMRVNPATSTIIIDGTTYYTATADL